jgi:hypothetical protein
MANEEQLDKTAKSLQARTDAKLRYAKIHLDELAALPIRNGGDFDRAHQESFLFHLFGARDAFLAELNHYYAIAVHLRIFWPADLVLAHPKLPVIPESRDSL